MLRSPGAGDRVALAHSGLGVHVCRRQRAQAAPQRGLEPGLRLQPAG